MCRILYTQGRNFFQREKTRGPSAGKSSGKENRKIPLDTGMEMWYSNLALKRDRSHLPYAGVAELADARDLKSRGSNPVPVRPRSPAPYRGVEQLVARRAHNPEVVGSSPTPATIKPSDFERNQTVFSISSSKKLGLVFQPLRLTHFLTHTSQKRGPDTALPCPGLALF